eukprot:COSAG04_NODE_1488_length_6555_cov_2.767658_2_plen_122_part_00
MDSMREQWAALDLDGSGDLDRGEFEAVMTSLATSDWTEAFDEDSTVAATGYKYRRVLPEPVRHRLSAGRPRDAEALLLRSLRLRPQVVGMPTPVLSLTSLKARSGGQTSSANEHQRELNRK